MRWEKKGDERGATNGEKKTPCGKLSKCAQTNVQNFQFVIKNRSNRTKRQNLRHIFTQSRKKAFKLSKNHKKNVGNYLSKSNNFSNFAYVKLRLYITRKFSVMKAQVILRKCLKSKSLEAMVCGRSHYHAKLYPQKV